MIAINLLPLSPFAALLYCKAMAPSTLWTTVALIPLIIPQATALIFELSPHVNKRQPQHHRLAQKARRAAPVLPATWAYLNCYTDGTQRTLSAATFQANTMTVDQCVAYCDNNNYLYAGVEYSKECYCDNAVQNGGTVAQSGCDMMCAGDGTQVCGGGNRLSVYKSSKSPPAALAEYNGWGYQGCYTDTAAGRTLAVGMGYTAPLTPEKCLDACRAQGYQYAGLEYSVECYCGNGFSNGGTLASDATTCDMKCAGDSAHICGGGNRLSVYEFGAAAIEQPNASTAPTTPSTNGWNSMGCYTDNVNQRTLSATQPASNVMTIEMCQASCSAGGYKYAGVEWSVECYCANTITLGAGPATDGRCDMACAGNPGQTCGGGNGINMYEYGASSTITAPTTTVSSAPSANGWNSMGCYTDNINQRTLSATQPASNVMTIEMCQASCSAGGYKYAGVEWSVECYCANTITLGAGPATDGRCDMACSGNPAQICGGGNGISMYEYAAITGTSTATSSSAPSSSPSVSVPSESSSSSSAPVESGSPSLSAPIESSSSSASSAPSGSPSVSASDSSSSSNSFSASESASFSASESVSPSSASSTSSSSGASATPSAAGGGGGTSKVKTTDLPGQYKYAGCFMEPGANQTVFTYQITDAAMSVEFCANKCSAFGYGAAALESGSQCWCGDSSMVAANMTAPYTDCNIPCVGSPADTCGGAARFTLYSWDFSVYPLYVWNTPANTGHYELLIGGIVNPLIATLGLNNKVTFLEKGGTGASNSTGAYELDYQLANDYTKAWRVMHVASDVSGATNLVLPDKKGRILSIGGSSSDSTQGIRLYTPSGSTGVNGTTDWEEYYDQIHLQQGRWSPSAMQMANGSILVIGGEDGSNGTAVPTLEILPTPDGGPTYLEMDWLKRTDPNILNPFLFILPWGGIFVIYYNEARILDEITFETTKTFPIIPGQVNAAGGRTYPMEGTSMILPQYYPYVDPVEILTCGGSAFGQAFDNCVSIRPDDDDPTWVVERMPSKRVMTIMAALPDGTYIIMGGAQQGVAGFGQASKPNLQAILYDPGKPRHQRFSILGETSVARLYNSEAILLHDGRVLITGSDPEDNGQNPQEYRMEVYVPPYLSSGLIQPTYTIANRDWAFGGSYTIRVNLFQGSAFSARASLMGAVSTTHGNSFGQRTFFPNIHCAGTTCQITAPPNSHVCPPGWYQLFILDGGTPSKSQWVRIGGDPAQIGNWPNYPGFTLPNIGGI